MSLMVKNFNKFYKSRSKERSSKSRSYHAKDLLVESAIVTIVGDPDTIPMSVRHPTKEEKILQEEEAKEKNHHQERGGEMIAMNEDHHGETKIRKGRIIHQGIQIGCASRST